MPYIPCVICQRPFYATPGNQIKHHTRFCSRACFSTWKSSRPPSERFWEKVHKTDTCWLWQHTKTKDGYGRFWYIDHLVQAHHFSWFLHYGFSPQDLYVLHRCDVPSCVRVDHLFLGTQTDNMQDMLSKNRQAHAIALLKFRAEHPETYLRGENNPRAKLKASEVIFIRESFTGARGQIEAFSRQFHVSPTTISRVLRREIWKQLL